MRILFSAAYSAIEPLGLLHLAGLARDMGWGRKISLVKGFNVGRLFYDIVNFKPDPIGFNIYTGNHLQTFAVIDQIKKHYPNIGVIVGGPHPTYFPMTAAKHADYVVMSEGFTSLQQIMSSSIGEGILPFHTTMRFPMPDRHTLYDDYPEFAASKIKSIIGMTGCPYRCTYCYNSSSVDDIKVTPELAQEIGENLGMSGRLFPFNIRPIEDLLNEGQDIVDSWPTDLVYFQDDVHGFDTKEWLPRLAGHWKETVGLPYHAQMRWEMVNGDGGRRRLDLIKKAGCTGLTLAIEAANHHIRKEVLDRATSDELMFDGMTNLRQRGLKVRTEQITALPYGATTKRTPINLEADLEIVELNVRLQPDMAWASTFAPYAGTKLGKYADKHGHYDEPENYDVPDSFFDRSVLRFPKEWTGPSLNKNDRSLWLPETELERYRDQNAALRSHFNLFCLLPDGHKIARRFLCDTDLSVESLCELIGGDYFDHLPKGDLARQRYKRYAQESGRKDVLSTAVRHHLYEEVLYK